MSSNIKFGKLSNDLVYLFSSLLLYLSLYVLIGIKFSGSYNIVIGLLLISSFVFLDYYFSKRKFRVYFRILIFVVIFLFLKVLVLLFSSLSSSKESYNFFIDKLPYFFNRDTVFAIFFILFYFMFDSIRIIKKYKIGYAVSTFFLVLGFYLCISFDVPIKDTIFRNYLSLALFLIFIVSLFIFRHMLFHQKLIKREFESKDLLLFLSPFLAIIFIFFSVSLPDYIKSKSNENSGLLNQNLFQFDFSNFVELRDEIKLSKERVLIMELLGIQDSRTKRINRGWNRQIYLKRFSLEEYDNDGQFKLAEKYTDPNSPPIYLSGYPWFLEEKKEYRERVDIAEILYLINIDPTSLMGTELITGVVPMTNWKGSPYKQIYKSFCYMPDFSYNELLDKNNLVQTEYLSQLNPGRKKLLLSWGEDTGIKELAESIIGEYEIYGYQGPFFKAVAIQEYLKNHYYYSLRPGLAKDGNQLNSFLFDTKKGYCSYFAFSMVLMLRSLGVASRVVVGFAPDMKNKTLNFYEVLSLHAHAWVEIYFDDYGWLIFDPTSSNYFPGEEYEQATTDKEERNNLIEQILKNRNNIKEIKREKEQNDYLEEIIFNIKHSVRLAGILFLSILIFIAFMLFFIRKNYNLIRYYISSDVRKKAKYLYRHIVGILIDFGYRIGRTESVLEYSNRIKNDGLTDITLITRYFQSCLFKEKGNLGFTSVDLGRVYKKFRVDINKKSFREKIKAFFNISRLWKKIFFVLLVVFLAGFSINLNAEGKKTFDELLMDANLALISGYYDKGFEILNKAEEQFPDRFEPNFQKGVLYHSHELYESALKELLKAKAKGSLDDKKYKQVVEQNYSYIASSYGNLGEEKKALEVYEEAFDRLEPSEWLYDKIGWMCYKAHEINKGIEKMKEGLEKYKNSPELFMTLGTLYSSIRDYDKAKEYYIKSIDYSYEDFNTNYFRSIAYYNLSLLEHSFLYYDYALNSAHASLNLKNRSSSHLELSYLYTGNLDLKNAYNEVIIASGLKPKTRFPEMSIVQILMLSGRIDDAISLVKKLITDKDFSWMLYFGTNKDLYYGELYYDLSELYDYKSKQINYIDKRDIISDILRPFKKIYYKILSLFYNYKYTNIYIKIGEEKLNGGSQLEGFIHLYEGFEKIWPAKALKLLKLAEQIEKKLNPQKMKIYNIQKAILREKTSLFFSNKEKIKILEENLNLLDPDWEKKIKADTMLEIAKSTKGNKRTQNINELFLIHSPYIAMNNLPIYFNIKFIDSNFGIKQRKQIVSSLKKYGIKVSSSARFILEIDSGGGDNIILNIYDYGTMKKRYVIEADSSEDDKYKDIGFEIVKSLFIVDII